MTGSACAARQHTDTQREIREEPRRIVDEDYQHKSYAAREAKVAEFDAFCSRMCPDDYLLTTSQGKAFLGRLTGEARYEQSADHPANLRRNAEWLNPARPVPFARLPQPLPAKLRSQSDVVELTENIGSLESLLADLGIDLVQRVTKPVRALAFPPATADLATELFMDRDWLQQQVDLFWDRRQIILYGPPGTGKTYLARKLAGHPAEPDRGPAGRLARRSRQDREPAVQPGRAGAAGTAQRTHRRTGTRDRTVLADEGGHLPPCRRPRTGLGDVDSPAACGESLR